MIALSSTFVGCSANEGNEEVGISQSEKTFKAGTYTATGQGNNGSIKVEVVLSDTAIESITILESSETAGLGDTALQSLIEDIIAHQSLGVDTVTGASNSSKPY